MIFIVMLTFISLSNSFVYCYFCGAATDKLINFGDFCFQMNWMKLPNDSMKCLILIIGNAHQPFPFHGFGIVTLNLETFLAVNFVEKLF